MIRICYKFNIKRLDSGYLRPPISETLRHKQPYLDLHCIAPVKTQGLGSAALRVIIAAAKRKLASLWSGHVLGIVGLEH